jgi:uncharacterized protein (UPF0248 family)
LPVNPLKETFNRLMWDLRERIADYEITYVHRGAPDDRRTISARQVGEVSKSWFSHSDAKGEENMIPFHRVIEIRNRVTGEVIWHSRRHN